MLSKFLDPMNDIAFKRIFGTEKNKDILIHFLNDMIVFKERKPIVDVTFLKTSQDPDVAYLKTSIVDVLCQDTEGNTYVVEMQVAQTDGFEKRAQYYASKAYISQMEKGDDYHNLKEVIFLAIVDYVMFPEKKKFKSDHVILDRETFEHDLKGFSFTFLELKKFNKDIDHLTTMIDKWAYFFKHADETKPEELEKMCQDPVIHRAYDELEHYYWTEDELLNYEELIKKKRDYKAEINFEIKKGKEEGIEIGIEKGKKEEREKAKEELDKTKKKMAHALLKEGVSIKIIEKAAGLTKDQIQSLLKK